MENRIMSIFQNKKFVVMCLIIVAVFASYSNALFNQFVWDDGFLIVENPYIKNFKFIPSLFVGDLTTSTVNAHRQSGYYRPLSMISFMMDYAIWGTNPAGYHLTNILVHVINSLFIFWIVSLISRNIAISFLSALFFAVHPIHVEAVTPVYNRMGIQAAFFMFLGLIFFIKSQRFTKIWYVIASMWMLFLGLLFKENVIILPAIFLCYDYFYFSDLKVSNIFKRKNVLFYFSCAVICVLYLWIRSINIARQMPGMCMLVDGSLTPALAKNAVLHFFTALTIINKCIIKLILPLNLSAVYWVNPVENIVSIETLLSIIVIVSVVYGAYFFRKRSRDVSFFIVLFFIGIAPYSNIIPIAESYTFRERFLYFSSISICFLAASLVHFLINSYRNKKEIANIVYITVGALVILMSIYTATSNYTWRNDLSLWQRTVESAPESQLAHLNLGKAYLDSGKSNEALLEFQKSMNVSSIKAGDSVYLAQINIVGILIDAGLYTQALHILNDAVAVTQRISINPFALYDKLGLLHVKMGDRKKAEEYFKKALYYNKNFITTHYNLGLMYYENGDYESAKRHLSYAWEFDKDFIVSGYALGLTYIAQDNKQDAHKIFQEILKTDPKFILAREYLNLIESEE